MERIQSAIEKARSRRAGPAGGAVAGVSAPAMSSPMRRVETPARAPGLDDAWMQIPEFIPDAETLSRNRVLSIGHGAEAVPFQMMQTKILLTMQANGWKRLAVTSPGSACGKSTICLNLAFGLTRQTGTEAPPAPDPETAGLRPARRGLHVGLIEMDMRRPSLSRLMGLPAGGRQFSEALAGAADPAAHMMRYGTRLAFGLSPRPVDSPAALLRGNTAGSVLDEMETRLGLDLTIFDMPPMLVSDDMLAFSGKVDCVLLIAAAESSTIAEIDRCERDLTEHTNVLGVVLNKCRYGAGAEGYGYS